MGQSVLGTRSSFLCYLTLAPSSLLHLFALYPVISGKFPEASGASSLLMSSHNQTQKGPCFSLTFPEVSHLYVGEGRNMGTTIPTP